MVIKLGSMVGRRISGSRTPPLRRVNQSAIMSARCPPAGIPMKEPTIAPMKQSPTCHDSNP